MSRVLGLALLGLAGLGCTDAAEDAAPTSLHPTVTVPADPTLAACAYFEVMWVEQAQVERPAGMSGDFPNPHGEAAIEAAQQAFDASAKGSPPARRLGAEAEFRYSNGDPADFNQTVADFFRSVCGTPPPRVDCQPMTLCVEQDMESYNATADA